MPTTPTFLEYLTAVGSIATPILVLILTGIGWTFQHRIERIRKLEELLRADRIGVYNKILEPFIILLTKNEGLANQNKYKGKSKSDIAGEIILSTEYRQAAFQLALMGTDGVVRAYNDLMQFFYKHPATTVSSDKDKVDATREMMGLFGRLLLEIRKSVGNEKTSLKNMEMLEWLITDIKQFY